MKKVAIVGSCVSRELFRDNVAPEITVGFYCMHTCIPAAVAQATPLPGPVEHPSLSLFFQRNLRRDFTKSLFRELSEAEFDFVVIDCVEERYNLFVRGNEVISQSAALEPTDFRVYCEQTMTPVNRLDLPVDYFDEHIRSYTRRLIEACGNKPIILNMCHFVKYHIHGNTIIHYERDNVRKQNILLDHIYEVMLGEAKGRITPIDTRDLNFRGDFQHRWGPFPFHFEDAFYSYVLDEIRKLVSPKRYDVMSMHEYHGSENSSQLWDDWHAVQALHVSGKDAECVEMVERIKSGRKLTPMECHYAGRSYLRMPGHQHEALQLLNYAVNLRCDEAVWANLFLAKCRRELHDPFGALAALSAAVDHLDNIPYAATMILEEYCNLIGDPGFNANNYSEMRRGLEDFCRKVPIGRT